MGAGRFSAWELLGGYCQLLYRRLGAYEKVGRQIGLDRRTVKKYVDAWRSRSREEDSGP